MCSRLRMLLLFFWHIVLMTACVTSENICDEQEAFCQQLKAEELRALQAKRDAMSFEWAFARSQLAEACEILEVYSRFGAKLKALKPIYLQVNAGVVWPKSEDGIFYRTAKQCLQSGDVFYVTRMPYIRDDGDRIPDDAFPKFVFEELYTEGGITKKELNSIFASFDGPIVIENSPAHLELRVAEALIKYYVDTTSIHEDAKLLRARLAEMNRFYDETLCFDAFGLLDGIDTSPITPSVIIVD